MPRAPAAAIAALAGAALALAACSSATQHAQGDPSSSRHDPLLGLSFYVDPRRAPAEEIAELRLAGQTAAQAAESAELQKIARRPTAQWFTGLASVQAPVREYTLRATRAHRASLLVAYDIPGRDCGGYSAGGAPSPAAYRRWIDGFAAGIGERDAVVILEPDAITQALSGCAPGNVEERYALLRYAVGALKLHRNTRVYIDAGNPGWIKPASRLAQPLQKSGIAQADGFSLNVANFFTTSATIAYGESLSQELGGTHFVIDTSRNGNGPEGSAQDQKNWCNPRGRALGAPPSTNTASPLVDAYLWIKEPGTSDGACRPGEPRAGVWWPSYALELARDTH
jgi:endoglucanase